MCKLRYKHKNNIQIKISMILENSKNAWHYLNQGLTAVYYNKFKKAVSKFSKSISLEPENMVAHLHKGTTLYKMKDYQKAILRFDKAQSNHYQVSEHFIEFINYCF